MNLPDPGGDGQEPADELFLRVYHELHRMAHKQLERQGPGHTLQTTALVNEVYFRVFGKECRDREHYLAVSARAMRSILVDHARKKNRDKRKAAGQRVSLDELVESYSNSVGNLSILDEALNRLAELDPQMARLVELRFFGGLTMTETAALLGVSERTAHREWNTARAWLKREMR